jgi:hypothetical protein
VVCSLVVVASIALVVALAVGGASFAVVPLARGLVRLPRLLVVGVVVVLTVVVAWDNAYVLVVWPLSP